MRAAPQLEASDLPTPAAIKRSVESVLACICVCVYMYINTHTWYDLAYQLCQTLHCHCCFLLIAH